MKEKHSSIEDIIYRSLKENPSYAYEIIVEGSNQRVLVVPRTNNIEAFSDNIETANTVAIQISGVLKVCIYRGRSPKAGLISDYEIPLDDSRRQTESSASQSQIEQAVDIAIKKYQMGNNIGNLGSLESINMLFGAFTGSDANDDKQGNALNGLAGLLGAVNNSRHENTLIQFERKLSDYKQETHINSLQKQLENLTTERDVLKQQNQELEKASSNYKSDVSELENRLAGYSNTEILKRVATGVISGIGSKLLAGSPKAAELLGLTKQELQGALGFVEEDVFTGHSVVSDADVDVEELSQPKTEQQKQLYKAINDTANALKKGDMNFAYYMITIVGNCMDSQELTTSMVNHLENEKQRLNVEKEVENTAEEK
jgi:hypothetical protein